MPFTEISRHTGNTLDVSLWVPRSISISWEAADSSIHGGGTDDDLIYQTRWTLFTTRHRAGERKRPQSTSLENLRFTNMLQSPPCIVSRVLIYCFARFSYWSCAWEVKWRSGQVTVMPPKEVLNTWTHGPIWIQLLVKEEQKINTQEIRTKWLTQIL